MIKYITLFLLMITSVACGQLKPFIFTGGNTAIADTTTNIYLKYTTGSDSDSGLDTANAVQTFYRAKQLVNAPTDSIFVVDIYSDSAYTLDVSCSVVAYDPYDPPEIDGADLVSNWTQIITAAVTDTSNTLITGTSQSGNVVVAYNVAIPAGMSGTLKSYIIRGGASGSSAFKVALGMRSAATNPGTIKVLDSTFVASAGLSASAWNTVNRTYGRFLSPDTFRVVISFETSASDIPRGAATNDTSWAYKVYTGYRYTIWQEGDNTIDTISFNFANYGSPDSNIVGLILETAGSGSSNIYWAVFADTVYQIQTGAWAWGWNEMTDASLLDSTYEWHYSNDSLYMYFDPDFLEMDTISTYATTRDGITISAQSNLSGFEIIRTRNALTIADIDTLEISSNLLKQNVYGIIDTAGGTSLIHHNKIANNQNNVLLKNKDTVYFWNNTVFSYREPDVATSNFTSSLSKLSIFNNMFQIDNGNNALNIGTIDLLANIIDMDYNGYSFDWSALYDNKFWDIAGTKYDSLSQAAYAALGFDDNSWEIRQTYTSPLNTISSLWDLYKGQDEENFIPREDSLYTSPLIDDGISLELTKDFYDVGIPQGAVSDIGAVELYISPNPYTPTGLNASISTTDSSYLLWSYTRTPLPPNVTKEVIYRNDAIIDTIDILGYYYDHPSRSGSSSIPTVVIGTAQNGTTTSVTIPFTLTPNNDTTYFRVRYDTDTGLDDGDSTAAQIGFRFIPSTTTYKVRTLDAEGDLSGYSNEATLAYETSFGDTINISGLTPSSTYYAEVTAYNDNGWVKSSQISFNTPGAFAANYYVSPWGGGDTLQTINEVNSINADSLNGKTVAFLGGSQFSDATLYPRTGATYTSYGTGKAIIGDSLGLLSPTVAINAENVTLDNLKVYGSAITGSGTIIYTVGGLTIQNCELVGGDAAHTGGVYHTIRSYTSGITNAVRITKNIIRDVVIGMYIESPYNVEIDSNEIYNIFRWDGYVAHGGTGIILQGSGTSAWDANYTVNVHHNNIHDFESYAFYPGTCSNIIFEYNEIHDNLDDRLYQGGINHGTVGKMFDNTNKLTPGSIGHIFRYNYVHDLRKFGTPFYKYGKPSISQIKAGTPVVLSTNTGYRQPIYQNAGSGWSAPDWGDTDQERYNDPVISGLGYANIWIHNNIFYNIDIPIFGRGFTEFYESGLGGSSGIESAFRNDLPSYFLNNTLFNCGVEYYAITYKGILFTYDHAESPTLVKNNIIAYLPNYTSEYTNAIDNGESSSEFVNNIFTNQSGYYTNNSVPTSANTAIWNRYDAIGYVTMTGNLYSTDPQYTDSTAHFWTTAIGVDSVYLPDLRILNTGNSDNTGVDVGLDPTGRDINKYDAIGEDRGTDNDIGALKEN